MARITFLGTGGGRVVVTNQLRASGGWVLEMDRQMVHVDPGPGALVRAKQHNVSLRRLTGIAVSHCHPDHYADLEVVIEAMNMSGKRRGSKKGTLLMNRTALHGAEGFHPIVSEYFLKYLEVYKAMAPGEKASIGQIGVEAVKAVHGDPNSLGFVFRGSRTIGYTSDGEHYEGMAKSYRGCDCLVIDLLRPWRKPWPEHMDTEHCLRLLQEARPKKAVIQHFGFLVLKAGPERIAKWLQDKSGVEVIAAKDGMRLEI